MKDTKHLHSNQFRLSIGRMGGMSNHAEAAGIAIARLKMKSRVIQLPIS